MILTLDLETTGLPPKDADYKTQYMDYPYIVTLAYKINGNETKDFIINQEGREIPEASTKIHGITTEMANASPHKILDVLASLMIDACESKLCVGHNIYFDSSIVKANVLRMVELKQCDPENVIAPIEEILHKDKRICTMKSTVKFCNLPGPRGLKWPKLEELYFKLFGKKLEGAHTSKGDCDSTYECFMELVKRGVIKCSI